MRKYFIMFFCLIVANSILAQTSEVFTLQEYLAYVKSYHPTVKQANLIISESESKLLKARGAFDPKLIAEFGNKEFEGTQYYNKFNSTFKIPTWYGLNLKGSYENNAGEYLNPQAKVPEDGLYNLGVSLSLARGFLINERMAILKQAKIYQNQAKADNQLMVNTILYKASIAYFNWLKYYQEKQVYEAFLKNAEFRFDGVKRNFELGESPAIDTTEAHINLNTRKLQLEKANLNFTKATIEISNYLWIDDTPLELKEDVIPDVQTSNNIESTLNINYIDQNETMAGHPKLNSLNYKYESLEIEKRLKKNNLLPQIDVQYNFLNQPVQFMSNFNVNNYKAGISVSFPLFLRKERADLQIAEYKLQAVDFEKQITELEIQNKVTSINLEISSYNEQLALAETIVSEYNTLLNAEERKFEIGESSLFLINSRESKLIESKTKVIDLQNDILTSKTKLFNILGIEF